MFNCCEAAAPTGLLGIKYQGEPGIKSTIIVNGRAWLFNAWFIVHCGLLKNLLPTRSGSSPLSVNIRV